MTLLDFHTPTRIVFGRGRLDELGAHTRPWGRTALIVCGRTSARTTGILHRALTSLAAAQVTAHVIDGIPPNPQSAGIDTAAATARTAGADVIVGIGGGSALDAAKAIAVSIVHGPSGPLIGTTVPPRSGCLPVIAVPTTAGSGAEVTKGAIITDTARGVKAGIRGDDLFPKTALIDPALTDTQPAHVAIASGFDALAHAVEGLAARRSSPLTEAVAAHALQLLPDTLRRVAAGDTSRETRDRMAYGALLGGLLVATASTCLPHRMQQAMGTPDRPGPSHGQGLALLYPAWLTSLEQAAPHAAVRISDALGTDSARGTITQLLTTIGLRSSLTAAGYHPDDIPAFTARITGNTDNDPHPDPGIPLITTIYERAL
ncbi:iron-containing alcohol dehydrogenase [Streptomyces sp. NPDC093109]|uniref:iron-containing alcohol dehydrogenase n=1 Tax=Streptomyces sp. NPDC093109 TaxID=3154977 RepID=UPI00344D2A31